jgi:hypothetical protein
MLVHLLVMYQSVDYEIMDKVVMTRIATRLVTILVLKDKKMILNSNVA